MLNLGFVQCTLMANSTPADIELLSGRPATRKSANPKQSIDNAQLRLRLSRQLGSLEIAKHVSGAQGEEWTKRILKTVKEDSSHICSADWESLDDDEKNAMEHLNRFWRLCVFLEEQERQVNGASKSQSPQRVEPRISLSSIIKSKAPTPPRPPSPSSASTRRLSGVYIPPRPLKFPALPPRRPSSFAKVSFASNGASIEPQHPSVTGKTHLATWCKEDDIEDVPPPLAETKYIPSVGWCIRQSSRVTQGGRYKIMFVDGAVLEIDVDEDWAEFTGQDGSTKRYNIRTGNMMRPIADRMKAFGEFVSMFEEQSTSR
ncbi:Protein kinase domain-containing protein [Mycena indigotica]|uniref:Protein kinase domain-containing protein n=1 Tax=Mycena indigotica TaxID=2126181 RepID=A0A8H6VYR0_9AGAR|nr:Protein kinase domain-containing protein [Mycena indigotica]KAF7299084.1 Protein kinase domain-containing protein [Mycena indigotica]